MWRDGEALPLSTDHKPYRFDELARIERSGGWVVNWHGFRVQGVLAISRSVGDYDLKPHVISTPELTVINRTDKDEFLILASDGLWDVISNIVACRVVRNCLTGRSAKRYPDSVKGHTAGIAASLLTRMAFSQRSLDNVSAVVIQFADLLE
ncbi:probable protein phosphatase 2C 8 [Asparagus officinalis]|nr:probable protein phosphatase 2C 8 [Asparagus officinalis]